MEESAVHFGAALTRSQGMSGPVAVSSALERGEPRDSQRQGGSQREGSGKVWEQPGKRQEQSESGQAEDHQVSSAVSSFENTAWKKAWGVGCLV